MHKKHKQNSKNKNNKSAIDLENKKEFEERYKDNKWVSAFKQDPVTDEQSHVQTDYRQLK